MDNSRDRILGIDTGSVMVSVVEVDLEGTVLKTSYTPHEGKPAEVLTTLLKGVSLERVAGIGGTASTPDVIEGMRKYDNRVAVIEGAKKFYPDLDAVLNVGGEKYFLTSFHKDGSYRSLKSNTSCAAGTGGFLDQQAKRLNLAGGSSELSEKARANRGDIPKIASRCSVFAKTDIIHSQQEGYSLEEICDGLCQGLAHNIADTLLEDSTELKKIVFSGGVALNKAVIQHLDKRLQRPLLVHEYSHLFGALGAAFFLIAEGVDELSEGYTAKSIKKPVRKEKEYYYEPLKLTLTDYPDFRGVDHYNFGPSNGSVEVEVDTYTDMASEKELRVFMGIDIGSTSTKAILTDASLTPVAGFYTRTAGRPIPAVQSIFEAITNLQREKDVTFLFEGVGTTGSGRKFIGKLISADIILDEISAHARAAYGLNPEVDTIIEIGGQDAKFTTLRNGVVTFSQMNTVCAAGTGSFIEEQAGKLGVSLADYSSLAEGARAPLASDRCTVYMERDINHYLHQNYSIQEILATALFSVRENYLQKVATEGNIGRNVVFQGATAKNRALVAAFEQKLKRPIFVSKYCHLTGALGAAITSMEEKTGVTTFKGLEIYKEEIPVRSETCSLCLNHCRIRVATVQNEDVAYGFLCGRDYNTKKYVKKEKVPALLTVRKKAAAAVKMPLHDGRSRGENPVVGIPAGLQIFEELPLWKRFFMELGIETVSTEGVKDVIPSGKEIVEAEFCAPMTAFHGHVRYAAGHADVVFLPIHLESDKDDKNPSRLRKYCYYTQFSSVVTSSIKVDGEKIKSMRPVINHKGSVLHTKYELFKAVKEYFPGMFGFRDISKAYDSGLDYYRTLKRKMKELYSDPEEGKMKVLLTGRPYTILSEAMNKGIPDFFAALGIETVYHDSLPQTGSVSDDVDKILDLFHWAYPAAILEAADYCAHTDGLYPVFVTSFKCSPDSFALEYFKRIMDSHEKPYLILQIDEHDSNVGYETRIEAGIRAFRNHLKSGTSGQKKTVKFPIAPEVHENLKGKTLLLPNWDPYVLPLVAANLRNAGIDARVLEETPTMIAASMRMNTGQCIPVNAIAHEYVEYIKKHRLDPGKTVLWMAKSVWACNITMYPAFIKSMIEKEGAGDAGVYTGELTMVEISPLVSLKLYFAFMFGGNLKKIGCMIRPYEINKGQTDQVLEEARDILMHAFREGNGFLEAVKNVIARIDAIPYRKTNRPKVAIFGDLYVRDNEVMNQDLVKYIEDAGGEVLLTPYNEYAKIISGAVFRRWIKSLNIPQVIMFKTLLGAMELLESRYHGYFEKYIGKPVSSKNPFAEEELGRFNIRIEQEGESYENVLKIFKILKLHPDVSLFIQTNPAFCCPSLITEAMSKEIEEVTGVPVLTITYDGTESPKNDVIIPYLKYSPFYREQAGTTRSSLEEAL